MEQGGFDLELPPPLYPATPTRLGTWADCPRRYRFSYVDRPPPVRGPAFAHTSVGAAVHSALADWWGQPRERRTPEVAADLVRRRWLSDGFRDAAQSRAQREESAAQVAAYVATLDPDDEPAAVERGVSTRTDRVALSGRLDRLDDRATPTGRALVVVDYKTGRWVPTDADAGQSLALAAYALAVSATWRRECRRVELHHLPSGTVASYEHTAESLSRKVSEADALAVELQAADGSAAAGRVGDDVFPPRPSTGCSWCDFRRHCPEGQAASEPVDPWSAIAPPKVTA